jgi:hypothetical protein
VILVVEFGRLFQEIAEGTHAWAAFSELQHAALKSFQSADAEAKKAKADLDKALAQGPCVGPLRDELDKLLKHDADEAEVSKLVDKWQAPGSNDRYFVKGELADRGAAIKQAREIVLGKGMLQSASFPTAQAKPRTYTRHQVEVALADMRRAIRSDEKIAARVKTSRARDKTLHDRIAALIR